MGIKQLYNDNLRKLPNEYGDVSVMTKAIEVACFRVERVCRWTYCMSIDIHVCISITVCQSRYCMSIEILYVDWLFYLTVQVRYCRQIITIGPNKVTA